MTLLRSAAAAACALACLAAGPVLADKPSPAQGSVTKYMLAKDGALYRADDPSLTQGFVTILSPADGTVLDGGGGIELTYTDRLTPEGDHFDVSVDGSPVVQDREVMNCPCQVPLPKLGGGAHTVTMQEATTTDQRMPLFTTAKFTVK